MNIDNKSVVESYYNRAGGLPPEPVRPEPDDTPQPVMQEPHYGTPPVATGLPPFKPLGDFVDLSEQTAMLGGMGVRLTDTEVQRIVTIVARAIERQALEGLNEFRSKYSLHEEDKQMALPEKGSTAI